MAKPKGVKLSNRTEKNLERIEARYRDRLKEAFRHLSERPLSGKPLKGEFVGLRSYRLGSFRIIYRSSKDLLEVVYLDDRKDVYR